MQSTFLSLAERRQGLKFYLRYTFLNGLGYAFMSETIVILLALNFGANNLQIGYLSSAIYITGIVSVLVPTLFAGQKVMTFFFWTWLSRSIVGLGYVGVFFFSGQTAVAIVLLTFTAYCLLRNAAYFLNQVVVTAISKRSELGSTSARTLVSVNSSATISRVVSFLVLSLPGLPATVALAALQGLGLILNGISAATLLPIPVRDRIERRGPAELVGLLVSSLKIPETRVSLFLNLGGVMLLVLFNFAIAFLRRDLAFSPSLILAFSVGLALAVIVSGRFGQLFIDRFGSKPFLVVTHVVLTVAAIVWAMLPGSVGPVLVFGLGFFTMFFLGLVTMLTGRLILAAVPAQEKVAFSAILALLAGMVALAAGLAGGLLADLAPWKLANGYSLVFVLMAMIAAINAVQSGLLIDKGSVSLGETAKVLFSVPNLQTFLSIDRLDHTANPKQREDLYLDIEYSSSALAAAEIGRRLHMPLMREKEMLIRSLFTTPRPELLPQLVEEALDKNSWWRQSAIFALGAYPGELSRQTLRSILADDAYIRSVAVKSLARLNDPESLGLALALLAGSQTNPRTVLNALIALSIADRQGLWLEEVFRYADSRRGFRFQQHVLVIAGKRLGTEPGIDYFFYSENLRPGRGFLDLLEEAREVLAFYQAETQLTQWSVEQDFIAIRQWCRASLVDRSVLGPRFHLLRAIGQSDELAPSSSDTLAMLYFTYQLHRDGHYEWTTNGQIPE